jgi:Spy/CpxP family protein refolding chaperone
MRGVLLLLVAASLTACANDVTGPVIQPQPSNALNVVSDSGRPWHFGRRGAMGLFMARRLPANLQLTGAQRSQIETLMAAFRAAHSQELTAMRTSMRAQMERMRAARESGQKLSIDRRRALFKHTAAVRERLMTAQRQLAAQIENVLTADQKAWLAAHRPAPCTTVEACHARFARRPAGSAQMRSPS